MFKQTVGSVSEQVFPGIRHSFTSSLPNTPKAYGREVVSSFVLQMALFFNVVFFPVWLTTLIVMLPLKFNRLPELNQIILIIALTTVIVIEVSRLYMGYLGNLTENIPGLAGFWMLSLLLQTPLQLLLLSPILLPSVAELVTQTVMCCLLSAQLVTGFSALHSVAHHSSAKFHLAQFLPDSG